MRPSAPPYVCAWCARPLDAAAIPLAAGCAAPPAVWRTRTPGRARRSWTRLTEAGIGRRPGVSPASATRFCVTRAGAWRAASTASLRPGRCWTSAPATERCWTHWRPVAAARSGIGARVDPRPTYGPAVWRSSTATGQRSCSGIRSSTCRARERRSTAPPAARASGCPRGRGPQRGEPSGPVVRGPLARAGPASPPRPPAGRGAARAAARSRGSKSSASAPGAAARCCSAGCTGWWARCPVAPICTTRSGAPRLGVGRCRPQQAR